MFKVESLVNAFNTSEGLFDEFCESLTDENFVHTKLTYGHVEVEDLTQHSSWSCQTTVHITHNDMVDPDLTFTLLKYKTGDFYKFHKDSKGIKTCLIFLGTTHGALVEGSSYNGGILTLRNELTTIHFHPSKISCGLVMVTFSVEFEYEISPILKGTCYVLKATIFDEMVQSGEECPENNDY
jgi:hypothetical protein